MPPPTTMQGESIPKRFRCSHRVYALDNSRLFLVGSAVKPRTNHVSYRCHGFPCRRRCWHRSSREDTDCLYGRRRRTEELLFRADRTDLKLPDVQSDQPQILGDKWQSAQFSLHRAEELRARAWHPMPGLGCRCVGRYMPRRSKTTEVIRRITSTVCEQGAQTVNAPTIACPAKGVPIINRIPPALPIRTEIVGRHSCDKSVCALRPTEKTPGLSTRRSNREKPKEAGPQLTGRPWRVHIA